MRRSRLLLVIAGSLGLLFACASEPRDPYRDPQTDPELQETHLGSDAENEARDAPRQASWDADAPPARRRMAITIDDLPVAQPSWHDNAQMERITEDLLTVLDEHGVAAAGFVNEGKLEVEGRVDPRRVALLERWLDGGHELGNHGHSHLDLHRVDPEAWMADVLRGERVTRTLIEARGGRLRWFRHPFLHVGLSVETQRATGAFLADRGYTVAPVTIDNAEWRYGSAYSVAYNEGDDELMRRLGEDYVRYMLEIVSFYEGQSEAILGREIPHVLLIHAYALNADWLDRLLDELESRGYGWIPLSDALEDPAYDRPIHGFTGVGGITWLHRWAITEGLDPAIFRGEPRVPQWVRDRTR